MDFSDPSRTRVKARGYEGQIEYFAPETFPGVTGVRFKDWRFKDIDKKIKDGALIEIDPGARTPVQLVEADKVISDVPLSGKLLFVHVDLEDNIRIYHFDSNGENASSYLFEFSKGEIVCWLASAEQSKPAEFMEYEEPGYTSADFTNIEPGTEVVSGRRIPAGFWETLGALEKGDLEGVTIPIVELDKLR